MMWNKWKQSFWKPLMYVIILVIIFSLVVMTGWGSCSSGVKETFDFKTLQTPNPGYDYTWIVTNGNGQNSTVNIKDSKVLDKNSIPYNVEPGQINIVNADNVPTTTLRFNPLHFKYDEEKRALVNDSRYPTPNIKALAPDGKTELANSDIFFTSDEAVGPTLTFSDDMYKRIMSDPIFKL